jgi:starvation-inducible DNA-binding protein
MPTKQSAKLTVAQFTYGEVQPRLGQDGREIRPYGTLTGLTDEARNASVAALNQLLADTITLRDLYKKHHWQVAGSSFYQQHLLFDKHYEEQSAVVDRIAERIVSLGGISIAMAHDVAEMTRIARPPKGREELRTQLSRLLEAHEAILAFSHEAADTADRKGDHGTNDLVVSDIIRPNELQVWFLSEYLADASLVKNRNRPSKSMFWLAP